MKLRDAKSMLKENQFYGSYELLNLFQQLPKLGTDASKNTVHNILSKTYKECDSYEKKQLFYSIIFSVGDITNREHNLFKRSNLKDVENGGQSSRKVFLYSLEWMLTFNNDTKNQFYSFLSIIGEYTNNQNLFFYQLRTDRSKGNVKEVIKLPIDINKVTDFIASTLKDAKNSDATLSLWAKFLPRPAFGKRKREYTVKEGREKSVSKKLGYNVKVGDTYIAYKERQSATLEKETFEFNFILSLSAKMDWDVIRYEKNTKFVGLENFKKKYLSESEASLFSSKKIVSYNQEKFTNWLNSLPSGSLYRVQRRLFNIVNGKQVSTNKWINFEGKDLATFYAAWEKSKIVAQERLLSLTEEDKKLMSKEEVKQMQKAAKVNVGADTLAVAISKIKSGKITEAQAKLISQNIFDKIQCKVPVFMWVDVSGSMSSEGIRIEGVSFSARELSAIALTAFMLKNPLREKYGNIFGIFSYSSNIVVDFDYQRRISGYNRYLYSQTKDIKDQLLVDPTKSFYENYLHIFEVIGGYDFASTDISSVSKDLKRWVDSDPKLSAARIEMIQQYPVHLYISDGDFNQLNSQSSSLLQHRANMKQWFGWDGLTVIWDCKSYSDGDGSKLRGVPNTMYFGNSNPGTLSQIFENIDDMDIIDEFAPLLAFSRTTRYAPVRERVLGANKANKIAEHSNAI